MKMKRTDASISVLLALTITMMLSFCLVLVESAREKTLLLKADIIWHACVNSVMAEYHKVLWDKYDVLYIDSSYQGEMPSVERVEGRLKVYADENLKYDKRGWLSLSCEGASLEDTRFATDYGGIDFYKKAIDSTEISMALSAIEELLAHFDIVEGYIDKGEDLSNSKSELSNQIEAVNETEVVIEDETQVVEMENPIAQMKSGNLLLKSVLGEGVALSQKSIAIDMVASQRTLLAGSAPKEDFEVTMIDKALFISYIQEHFGNYVKPLEDGALSYEMEYMIAGKESDIENLEAVTARLLLYREVDNYLCLLTDEAKCLEAHAIAAAVSSAVPWMEPVIYQATLLYWAYEKSINDLQQLYQGNKIPVCKIAFQDSISFDYTQYLSLFLLLQQREMLTMRVIDMIECSIRVSEKGFRMDGCLGYANVEGYFRDGYQKRYTITQLLQYE